MDTSSGRVISNEQFERLKLVDPREAGKFSQRLTEVSEAVDYHPSPVRVEYTPQELKDLEGLRALRKRKKAQRRSGQPARKREAVVMLEAIEIEVRKIHAAAERRAGKIR
jgi:hypothetical protein